MRWTCIQTASLVGARTLDLGTAQRLALEDHLTGCVACRETAQLGIAFRKLLDAQSSPAPASSIDRTIHRALRDSGRNAPRPAVRTMPRILAIGALGLAAVATVTVWSSPRHHETANRRIHAGMPTQLGHGRVVIMGDGTWMAATSTLMLERGNIVVAVDPGPHRRFAVQTERFLVEVLGTRFRVDTTGVDVFEGHVRISDLDGTVRIASLNAGEHWRLEPVKPPVTVVAEPAPVAAHPVETQMTQIKKPVAAPHLERARSHLANKEVASARREIALALGAGPTRAQRATAAVLTADASFVEGDTKKAIELYRAAYAQFDDLLAGENALFAAARLQVKVGPAADAKKLLEQYLERYPHGEFSSEADAKLRELTR